MLGPPEHQLPIGAKQSMREMQIPVRKVKPWQEEMSWKVVGSNPGAGKGFFSRETSIKVYLWHHLVVEFVLYTYSCVTAQCINSLGRCARN